MNASSPSELQAALASDSHDTDPEESAEWRAALTTLAQTGGPARARWMAR